MINIGDLNFARKIRGRKPESTVCIPGKLTMRDCVGKVAEIYDPLGRITPLLAGKKLDVSKRLVKSNISGLLSQWMLSIWKFTH